MYGILGEDRSDAATLTVLVKRLANDESLSVRCKGFRGGGKLFRQGARELQAFEELGCTRLIACHDADGPDPAPIHERIEREVIRPANLKAAVCIVVPVQELEAWILADIEAVTNIMSSWKPDPIEHPENIASPKELLEKLSRTAKGKPRYAHATHNEHVAKYLDLDKVETKCPSFKPLADFVRAG